MEGFYPRRQSTVKDKHKNVKQISRLQCNVCLRVHVYVSQIFTNFVYLKRDNKTHTKCSSLGIIVPPLPGFEPRISGLPSWRFTNWAIEATWYENRYTHTLTARHCWPLGRCLLWPADFFKQTSYPLLLPRGPQEWFVPDEPRTVVTNKTTDRGYVCIWKSCNTIWFVQHTVVQRFLGTTNTESSKKSSPIWWKYADLLILFTRHQLDQSGNEVVQRLLWFWEVLGSGIQKSTLSSSP